MKATIKKTFVRGMNVYVVKHAALKSFTREFIGNKNKQAAEDYAVRLDYLAKLATEAKA